MKHPTPKTHRCKCGFTLVEILVVVVIATVVLAIAIPRIRTVNKERNIREASRVVGSIFANASQRAVIDGVAGVRISRNPNFIIGAQQFRYAATELSILRRVPNYIGDAAGAMINNALDGAGLPGADNQIAIPLPLEQTSLNIVRPGDSIAFGNSSARYNILAVNPGFTEDGVTPGPGLMHIVVDLAGYLPPPTDMASFSIFRRPRILRSSTTVLPAGHIIDLRYSGFEVLDGFGVLPGSGSFDFATGTVLPRQLTTVFEPVPTDFIGTVIPPLTNIVQNYDIDVIFDEDGTVDTVLYTELDNEDGDATPGETVIRKPLGSLHFLVTEAPESLDTTEEISTADETNFWVTVSNNTGTVNIGYNDANDSQGFTVANLSTFYFGTMPGASRGEFNAILDSARSQASTVTANQ